MKYTVKTKLKDGSTVYRFIPPKDAKLSGVVKNKHSKMVGQHDTRYQN